MKTLFFAAIVTLVCGLSFSCNSTIGFGRDLRILGENMEHAAVKKQGGGSGGGDNYQDTGGAPVY